MGKDEDEAQRLKEEEKERKKLALKDQMMIAISDAEKKAENKALSRRLYAESKEAHYSKGFAKAQEAVEWREKEVLQEVAFAQHILADRIKDERNSNHRRLLRESQELQELESRLRAAYIQKELYTQLEAKKAEQIRTELEHQEEYYRLRTIQEAANRFEEERRIAEANKKLEYRNFLQDQMIEKHKKKVEEYREALEEKARIDNSMKTFGENEKSDEENRLKKIEELKNDIAEFNKSREAWMLQEKQKEADEDRKIKEYLEEKFKKDQEQKEKERKREEAKLKFHEVVVNVLQKAYGKRSEEEYINQVLLDEDSRLKEEAKLKADYEKKMNLRQELREVFAKQVEDKLRSIEDERRMDYEYCEAMIKENEESNKREKQLEAERNLNRQRYAQELKDVIEERQQFRQREMYLRINEYHALINENKNRLKEIDDERIRMLQEHGTRLLGFLPKGVIRNRDLPYLDPAIQKFYNYSSSNE